MPELGTQFAGYRIDDVVGRGGMGVVYRATELALDRPVALKLIAPELASDASFRERFLGESRLAASIDHAGILPVYAAGEADGELYLANRFVDGHGPRALIDGQARFPPSAHWGSSARWRTHSTQRTRGGSSIETSSRGTCSSTRPTTATCPTSA